jgi:hypothetical protein
LPQGVGRLVEQTELALTFVATEDLGRSVARAVVGRDDEVDPVLEVVAKVLVEDVLLVADEEGHHNLHVARLLRTSERSLRSTRIPRFPSTSASRCSSSSSRR